MFDFKKEYKEFYLPENEPQIVTVPRARYLAVEGKSDPNQEGGAYQKALELLYAAAYTIKMSPRADRKIEGYFEYVVPPLEGFWYQEGIDGMEYGQKEKLCWVSVIRLPEFVREADFEWAAAQVAHKKKLDVSPLILWDTEEGLCVQCMHVGPYDDEPATVARMDEYLCANGYENDFTPERRHHEIYLSDARRVSPDKWRTVIRHPVRKL